MKIPAGAPTKALIFLLLMTVLSANSWIGRISR